MRHIVSPCTPLSRTTKSRRSNGTALPSIRSARASGLNTIWSTTCVVEAAGPIPTDLSLSQNCANRLDQSTGIHFVISAPGIMWLNVQDLMGFEVAVLVDEQMRSGTYERTLFGNRLASGVYVYRLVTGAHTIHNKIMIVG